MGLVYHVFLKLQYCMGYKSNYFGNYFIFGSVEGTEHHGYSLNVVIHYQMLVQQ